MRASVPKTATLFRSGTLPPVVPRNIDVVFVLLRCRRLSADVLSSSLYSVRARRGSVGRWRASPDVELHLDKTRGTRCTSGRLLDLAWPRAPDGCQYLFTKSETHIVFMVFRFFLHFCINLDFLRFDERRRLGSVAVVSPELWNYCHQQCRYHLLKTNNDGTGCPPTEPEDDRLRPGAVEYAREHPSSLLKHIFPVTPPAASEFWNSKKSALKLTSKSSQSLLGPRCQDKAPGMSGACILSITHVAMLLPWCLFSFARAPADPLGQVQESSVRCAALRGPRCQDGLDTPLVDTRATGLTWMLGHANGCADGFARVMTNHMVQLVISRSPRGKCNMLHHYECG